jgi:hypothetical protein
MNIVWRKGSCPALAVFVLSIVTLDSTYAAGTTNWHPFRSVSNNHGDRSISHIAVRLVRRSAIPAIRSAFTNTSSNVFPRR